MAMKAWLGRLAVALAILAPAPALAQTTTGELTGRINDASGQLVAGATVTAVHAGTGTSRTVTTNTTGEFTLTLLPPGRYTVTVERSGFKKAARENVEVLVGSRQTLVLQLEVGAVSETVTCR